MVSRRRATESRIARPHLGKAACGRPFLLAGRVRRIADSFPATEIVAALQHAHNNAAACQVCDALLLFGNLWSRRNEPNASIKRITRHAMKKFLLAGAVVAAFASGAQAADLGVQRVAVPSAIAAPVFNWTGFYLGLNAGYAWGSYTQFSAIGVGPGVSPKGFVGGGQIGYNYQINNIVLGLETDFQSGPRGSSPVGTAGPFYLCGTGPCTVNINWFGTARARAGVAVDRALIYATGGLAYGHFNGGIQNSTYIGSSTKVGYALGAGLEYAFTPNFTAKVEYLYTNLGAANFGVDGGGNRYRASGSFHTVRLGVNYLFSTGPSAVVARY
jgi:outer membrane immunogenic protein